MRISDWSSDVCSSDLCIRDGVTARIATSGWLMIGAKPVSPIPPSDVMVMQPPDMALIGSPLSRACALRAASSAESVATSFRSEEHTSELQSLMRISYAVFCLKKKKQHKTKNRL